MSTPIEMEPMYNVPTDELLKKFPITYETPAEQTLELKVQNRMLNGFNTWNLGYDAWQHWGEVLYTPDSMYNVHGVRLTLREYQMAMNIGLKAVNMQMGRFNNMILCGDWTAIRYEVHNTDNRTGKEEDTTVMEFVKFADHGDLGAKVVEGWGGVKGPDYAGMQHFQTAEEQAAQKAFMDGVLAMKLADTDDLEAKYPVVYPTPVPAGQGEAQKALVLKLIDAWNNGTDSFKEFAEKNLAADGGFDVDDVKFTRDGLTQHAAQVIADTKEKRVRINNILVNADWAAFHYWSQVVKADGTPDVKESMEFLHFVQTEDGLKIDKSWLKG